MQCQHQRPQPPKQFGLGTDGDNPGWSPASQLTSEPAKLHTLTLKQEVGQVQYVSSFPSLPALEFSDRRVCVRTYNVNRMNDPPPPFPLLCLYRQPIRYDTIRRVTKIDDSILMRSLIGRRNSAMTLPE